MIKVKLFASLKKLAGKEEIEINDQGSGITLKEMTAEVEKSFPKLGDMVRSRRVLIAVNQETVSNPDFRLKEGDEIALLPPFAGGAGDEWVRIQKEDFSVEEEINRLKKTSSRIGGIVTFIGTARDFSQGRNINKMEFEYYPVMAEKKLQEIREQALKDFKIIGVTIIHRVGDIAIGDNIVLIVVVSQHRGEAFKACSWCIDELKRITPIWKKEITPEGEVWVEEHP